MKYLVWAAVTLLTSSTLAESITVAEFEKLNGGIPADLNCFSMLMKSVRENHKTNQQAETTLKTVHELTKKKEPFKFELIPMFDDLEAHREVVKSALAYGETVKGLTDQAVLLGLQKMVQKKTSDALDKEKVNFYPRCREMLYSAVGKCKKHQTNSPLFSDCFLKESEKDMGTLLSYAVGQKTFEERLKKK